jgi:type II secretory pathway component GspD/PulD (secretin)
MYRQKSVSDKMQIGKGLALTCFISTVIAIAVFGSVEPGSMGANPDEGSRQAGSLMPVEVTVAVSQAALQPVQPAAGGSARAAVQSFELKEQFGIRDALAMLASLYKKNIVPSPGVDGQLAFRSLKDVTFEEAMDAILGENFKYQQQGSLIKVYTKDEFKKIKEDPERMVYQMFTLYYVSAAEAKKLVTPILSQTGRLETTTAAVTDFPTGESITKVTGGGDATAMNDTIIVHDYPENVEQIAQLLGEIDVRPRQVLIEATVLSVTLTEDTQFGINWSTLQGVLTQIPAIPAAAGDITRGSSDYFKSAGTGQVTKTGGLTVGFAHDNIAGFIRAIEEVSDVTILANPKILAVNKQLGQVYIGKKLGYQSQTTQTEISTTQSVEFLDTGTKLSFRPYIGNDGYIRMDIHPKDSSGTLKANNIPDETSAELVSNIIVKDGQTIVIGGLFRNTVTTGKTQIPLLGDIPIVGVLFRGTADQSKREEVVVLLTPHIIEEPNETDGQARAEDVSRKIVSSKDEMLGIGRAKLADDCYAKAARYYIEGDNESAMKELGIALWLRPTFLEAIRLKERILAETSPDEAQKLERIVLETVDRQAASKWRTR